MTTQEDDERFERHAARINKMLFVCACIGGILVLIAAAIEHYKGCFHYVCPA